MKILKWENNLNPNLIGWLSLIFLFIYNIKINSYLLSIIPGLIILLFALYFEPKKTSLILFFILPSIFIIHITRYSEIYKAAAIKNSLVIFGRAVFIFGSAILILKRLSINKLINLLKIFHSTSLIISFSISLNLLQNLTNYLKESFIISYQRNKSLIKIIKLMPEQLAMFVNNLLLLADNMLCSAYLRKIHSVVQERESSYRFKFKNFYLKIGITDFILVLLMILLIFKFIPK